jgi:aminoglycoside/choline kinase family phosphotransferase
MFPSPDARPLDIATFLDRQGWGSAAMEAFSGDFSSRRYARLTKANGSTAILMDADADQKTPQFVSLAKLLSKTGLPAPEILGEQGENGLVLMQDFGSGNIGGLIDAGANARPYYMKATELLAHLHRELKLDDALALELPLFNSGLFATQAELFLDGYIPYAKQRDATEEERGDFRAAMLAVLRPTDMMPQSLLLRDFMADNLMSLSTGEIGVLDFQDAGIGPVAYDLASLCEEVRRDGGCDLLPDVITHYRKMSQSPVSQADMLRVCTILSAQRHLRILGIIANLAMKKGRRDKLAYIPRILRHLEKIMAAPYLLPMQKFMQTLTEGT